MRKAIFSIAFLSFFGAFAVVACSQTVSDQDEEFSDKAAQLGRLAGAVDGLIKFGSPPDTLTGEQLLREAVKDNPALLAPFINYFVIARREGALSSVLLCSQSRKNAIAEDAGCTSARLDAAIWRVNPAASCSFTLNLIEICAAP